MFQVINAIVLIIALTVILLCILLAAKNNNACKNREKIIKAIEHYQCTIFDVCSFDDCNPFSDIQVDFSDMEPYLKTLFRLNDWGYGKILPPDKFELIKPFLKEK